MSRNKIGFIISVFLLLLNSCQSGVITTEEPTITLTLTPALTSTPEPSLSAEPSITSTPFIEYSPVEISETIEYQIHQTITLQNTGGQTATKVKVWVALIQDHQPYQSVLSIAANPAEYKIETDEYKNQFAVFTYEDVLADEEILIEINYEVSIYGFQHTWEDCQGELLDSFTSADKYIESNDSEITGLAAELSIDAETACEQAEAFYNFIGDNFQYAGYISEDVGALAAIQQGSGDCTEFADTFIALNRSVEIPARFLQGVTYISDTASELGDIKHDWTEVYLPGIGWVPVDPTWGQNSAVDRLYYFAGMSPDHIIVTMGRNLTTLDGYHYFYYQYWWAGNQSTSIDSQESWSLIKK
jgi:hypothetical protein